MIGKDYIDLITTQGYAPRPVIDGVAVNNAPAFTDCGGNFTELLRLDQQGYIQKVKYNFKAAQVNVTKVMPGTIKAFHLHYLQEDLWCPINELLVGLVDCRQDSHTYKMQMRFILTPGQSLYIPRGVGHGMANNSLEPASMLYFVNNQFNAEAPDEHRLPWELLGEDFWTPVKG